MVRSSPLWGDAMPKGTTFLTKGKEVKKQATVKPKSMMCPECAKRGEKHRMVVMVDPSDPKGKKKMFVCQFCQHTIPIND